MGKILSYVSDVNVAHSFQPRRDGKRTAEPGSYTIRIATLHQEIARK